MMRILGMTTRVMKGGVSQFIADKGRAPPRRKDAARRLKMSDLFIFPTPFPPPADKGKRKLYLEL
jgi:hypothetical protein